MAQRVCPYWIGFLLLNPFRKLGQNPYKILSPLIKPDMTVLDFGSAMGYFSIPMANLVKPDGRVICVDIQEKMLRALQKRAKKAGVSKLIETCLAAENSFNLEKYYNSVDFALAFAVAHEVPDQKYLFSQLAKVLKSKGQLLFSEPSGHVSKSEFQASVDLALENNFKQVQSLQIRRSHSVLFEKVLTYSNDSIAPSDGIVVESFIRVL